VFRRLRKDHDNVGIVLQAYLHRTEEDAQEAVRQGDRVRLCKGAYREPASIAWTRMDEIRASFVRCARLLLERGRYPAIATHDEGLVRQTIAFARERGIAADRFEFQMLYGLRPRRWEELVRDGFRMRVYVPYGSHWFPYFYRRLRERKENVFFVLKSLLGG
jgi:proline dehydrogenase